MNHEKAREYIKRHIERSGHKRDIAITRHLVMKWWNLLNHAVFYGRLVRPFRISIVRLKGGWGECQPHLNDRHGNKRIEIRFRTHYATKKMFLDALVHEMVHMWEYQQYTTMGHCKRFNVWKGRIKRTTGLDLDKSMGDWEYIDENRTK